MCTERQWLHDDSVGFLLAYAVPGLLVASAYVGQVWRHADIAAALPLVVIYLLVPLLNKAWTKRPSPLPERVLGSVRWQWFYYLIAVSALPVQLATLYLAVDFLSSGLLTAWGKVLWVLSTGLISALFAINISHELMHSNRRFDRIVATLLLSSVGFSVFKVVHLRIHHRFVGTDRDFSSAPRGKSIYAYWSRALRENFVQGFRLDLRRSARLDIACWRSELVFGTCCTLLLLASTFSLWGWLAAAFFIAQSLVAILKLEWVNYLQHYGLRRACFDDGRPGPVEFHHAWSQDSQITNLALLNLMRHADHHVYPTRSYHALKRRDESLRYPYDFSIMFLLSLLPPLFRKVVHPVLDGERALPTASARRQLWSS